MKSSNNCNPVLLVHGIQDTGSIFHKMATSLEKLGFSVYTLDLIPNNGDHQLDFLAAQVADYVNKTFPPEQPFDLVGFSMGGIVSRYYVQRMGGIERVQRFVTISAPHNGTLVAYSSWRPGCVQMRPGCDFLKDLNRDVMMLKRINFTSIWTPLDLMIVPAKSSQLPVGKNIQILVPYHAWMVTDSRTIQAVVQVLLEPFKFDRQPVHIPDHQILPTPDNNI